MARTFVRVLAGGLIGSSAMAEAAPDRSAPKSQRPILVSAVSDTTLRAQALSAAPAEEEAPESAVSSPPMSMDDPGTPGPNGIEVNFVGTVVRLGSGRATESLLDANYGIGDRIQLKFERPYLTEGGDGEPTQKGLGATEVGLKWRFWDDAGLQMAVYPQYTFDDGFTLEDEEGNEEPTEGRFAYLPLLISKQVARDYTLAVNFGYGRNFDHSEDNAIVMALGVGRAIGESARILAELLADRDDHLHKRQTDVRAGYVQALYTKARWEFPIHASLGTSLGGTPEGSSETSFTFGVSCIRLPNGE